jgi:hypothetical protein
MPTGTMTTRGRRLSRKVSIVVLMISQHRLSRRLLVGSRAASGWGGLLGGLRGGMPKRSEGRGLRNLQRLQEGGPRTRTVSGSLMKRTVRLVNVGE